MLFLAFAPVAPMRAQPRRSKRFRQRHFKSPIEVRSQQYAGAMHPAGTSAYVTNAGGDTVSVITSAEYGAFTTLTVGSQNSGLAVTPNGASVCVAQMDTGAVSRISAALRVIIEPSIPAGDEPTALALFPGDANLYVTNLGDNMVSVISSGTNTVTATIEVGEQPSGVAIAPDGSRAHSSNSEGNSIAVISTASYAVIETIEGIGLASSGGPAITADGQASPFRRVTWKRFRIVVSSCSS
jgi:YVTN family beta-propeller protein